MRRPVAILAVGKDQRVVVTPSGEGFSVFEPGLAITDLFAHHFQVHMLILIRGDSNWLDRLYFT
jgi:hypothetical protein